LSARTRDTHERVTLKFMRKAKMSPEMMTEDDQGVAVPREFEMLRRCAKYEYILDYVDHHQTDVYWILVTKLFGVPWDKATAAQTSETAMDLPQLVATPAERQEFSLQREQAAAAAASVRPAAAAADAESAKPVQHQGVAALFEHGCMTRPVSHDLFECIDAHIQQPATTGANGLPPYLARYVFAQVALAVGYLHQRNIFHRDIKDENCLVDAMYRVRLIDFGSVTELPYGENNVQFTDFVGTMTYAPPQAVLHEPFLPAKNETWALGVLLYTMVFGCNPFASTEEALRGLRHIPDPDGIVDADLRSLLKGCLRVDEKQRYGITEILTSPWLYAQARALDPNGLVMRRFPARAGSTRRRQMVKSATEATEPANGLALAAEL
ncbi:kinase-like protein, partial [Caulochytrium protostelioides]